MVKLPSKITNSKPKETPVKSASCWLVWEVTMELPLLVVFWLINIKLRGKPKKVNISQTCMAQWLKCQPWKLEKLKILKFFSESKMCSHFLTQQNLFLEDGTSIQTTSLMLCRKQKCLIWTYNRNWFHTCKDIHHCDQFIIQILSLQIKLKEQIMLLKEQTKNNTLK